MNRLKGRGMGQISSVPQAHKPFCKETEWRCKAV
jgi:hypothetical protein